MLKSRACLFFLLIPLIIWPAESLIWLLHFLCEPGPPLGYRRPSLHPQPCGGCLVGLCVCVCFVCVCGSLGSMHGCSGTSFWRQLLKAFPLDSGEGGVYELQCVCVCLSCALEKMCVVCVPMFVCWVYSQEAVEWEKLGNRERVTSLTSCFGIDSCQMGLTEVKQSCLATAVLHL